MASSFHTGGNLQCMSQRREACTWLLTDSRSSGEGQGLHTESERSSNETLGLKMWKHWCTWWEVVCDNFASPFQRVKQPAQLPGIPREAVLGQDTNSLMFQRGRVAVEISWSRTAGTPSTETWFVKCLKEPCTVSCQALQVSCSLWPEPL